MGDDSERFSGVFETQMTPSGTNWAKCSPIGLARLNQIETQGLKGAVVFLVNSAFHNDFRLFDFLDSSWLAHYDQSELLRDSALF